MIVGINITTPLSDNFYPVKDVGGVWTQCTHSDSERIAVLRYQPLGAETVPGELYETNVTKYLPFEFTADILLPEVELYIRKKDDVEWLYLGKYNSTGDNPQTFQFGLLPTDVSNYSWTPGSIMEVRVKDSASEVEDVIETVMYSELEGFINRDGLTFLNRNGDTYIPREV